MEAAPAHEPSREQAGASVIDPTAPDGTLLEAARRGDQAAFGALVRRHERAVAGVVIRMLGPGDEADDVGQETFVRFHRALGSFRGDAAVRTYLVRIAMNLSLNAVRHRRWRGVRFPRLDDQPAATAAAATGGASDAELVAAERAARVERAVQSLDPAHRAVVTLRFFESHSTRETAAILDIPEGTVMSRLKRALDKLRPQLGDLVEES